MNIRVGAMIQKVQELWVFVSRPKESKSSAMEDRLATP